MAEGRLQQELLHKNVTIEALASALKKATDEKELLEKSNEETIQSLIQDVEGKNSQWRSILQKAEEEKEKIKKEKDELKKNNDTNEHVIQTLKWDVEDLKSKLQKSKEENEELEKSRTTVHSLKLDVKDVKSKLQKANAEKEKLKKNNDGNEETIRSLKFDLKEMEDKLCVQRLKLCVVSINIGKSYTELGFSMISHQRDIKTIRFHHNVDTINSCTACPSTVLLDKNGEFVSFGCKAEDEYSDKVKFHDNNDEYCLIHINDFLSDSRQSLDGTNTNRSTPIKGVSLDTVLKYIVRYLVDMTMETMNDRLSLVKGVDECLWIFPVHPSQFSTFSHGLKTGISEAGIKEGDYRLVPEPVLVGLHSQRILLKQKATDLEGGTFVVLDVGG